MKAPRTCRTGPRPAAAPSPSPRPTTSSPPPPLLMKTPTTRRPTIPRYQTRSPLTTTRRCRTRRYQTGGRRFCRGRLVVVAVEGPRVRRDLLRTNSGLARARAEHGPVRRVAHRRIGRFGGPGLQRQITVDLVAHHRTERTDRKLRHAFRCYGSMARRGRLLLAQD